MQSGKRNIQRWLIRKNYLSIPLSVYWNEQAKKTKEIGRVWATIIRVEFIQWRKMYAVKKQAMHNTFLDLVLVSIFWIRNTERKQKNNRFWFFDENNTQMWLVKKIASDENIQPWFEINPETEKATLRFHLCCCLFCSVFWKNHSV